MSLPEFHTRKMKPPKDIDKDEKGKFTGKQAVDLTCDDCGWDLVASNDPKVYYLHCGRMVNLGGQGRTESYIIGQDEDGRMGAMLELPDYDKPQDNSVLLCGRFGLDRIAP